MNDYAPTVVQAVAGDYDERACIDLDPWEMYEHAPVVADPLDVAS